MSIEAPNRRKRVRQRHTELRPEIKRVNKRDFQLFLALNGIDHTKTKAKSPLANRIRERFHKTILQEFSQVALRKKLYNF